jgi:hypothetical protein
MPNCDQGCVRESVSNHSMIPSRNLFHVPHQHMHRAPCYHFQGHIHTGDIARTLLRRILYFQRARTVLDRDSPTQLAVQAYDVVLGIRMEAQRLAFLILSRYSVCGVKRTGFYYLAAPELASPNELCPVGALTVPKHCTRMVYRITELKGCIEARLKTSNSSRS